MFLGERFAISLSKGAHKPEDQVRRGIPNQENTLLSKVQETTVIFLRLMFLHMLVSALGMLSPSYSFD